MWVILQTLVCWGQIASTIVRAVKSDAKGKVKFRVAWSYASVSWQSYLKASLGRQCLLNIDIKTNLPWQKTIKRRRDQIQIWKWHCTFKQNILITNRYNCIQNDIVVVILVSHWSTHGVFYRKSVAKWYPWLPVGIKRGQVLAMPHPRRVCASA